MKPNNYENKNNVHITDLRNIGLLGTCKQISGNLNTACGMNTGFYMGQNLRNSPSNSNFWFFIIHLVHNPTYMKQIAFSFNDDNMYVRSQINGSWTTWKSYTT